jgi:hypothetical protein
MVQRQVLQHFFPFGSQGEQHLTAILAPARPPNVARGGKPVHEFHGAVVLNLQSLSEFPNGRPRRSRQPFQAEHQLVLSWFQARGSGRLFAE